MKKSASKVVTLGCAALIAACQSSTIDPLTGQPQQNRTAAGAAIGAVVGAASGLFVARNKSGSDKRKSALIGAGIGALAGGGIGLYMDRQEAELRQHLQQSGVAVQRNGNQITLIMPSSITFASDSSNLNPGFYNILDSVAIVLNKYPQTLLDVDGHTDATGSHEYNQRLSEARAVSVGQYLASRGVNAQRLMVVGFGETRPIADNSTEYGKSQNRRVEVQIHPLT